MTRRLIAERRPARTVARKALMSVIAGFVLGIICGIVGMTERTQKAPIPRFPTIAL